MKRRSHDKLPHELFEMLEASSKTSERVELLKQYSTFAIKTILQAAFDPNIVFDLPSGAPEYKPDASPAGLQESPIHRQIRVLPKCVVGSANDTRGLYSKLRKEVLFKNLLEIVHAKDALILIAMKDRALTELYPTLKLSLVRKAFPDLIPAKQ
jgi:hypothetical protein